jgi:hypothetical protein
MNLALSCLRIELERLIGEIFYAQTDRETCTNFLPTRAQVRPELLPSGGTSDRWI